MKKKEGEDTCSFRLSHTPVICISTLLPIIGEVLALVLATNERAPNE